MMANDYFQSRENVRFFWFFAGWMLTTIKKTIAHGGTLAEEAFKQSPVWVVIPADAGIQPFRYSI
jgi:hypothetical protein